MAIKNWQEITLDSETFEGARQNFDMLLQGLFKKMEQNNSDEGTITLKVDINMINDYVVDEDGESKRITKPLIKHKVSTAVPVKDSFDGKKDTGMEIVYDEKLKRYVLKYASQGGQRSIFDPDFGDVINGTAREVEEEPIMVGEKAMLPGTVEEDSNGDSEVIDTEYEEVEDDDGIKAASDDTEVSEDDDYEYDEG